MNMILTCTHTHTVYSYLDIPSQLGSICSLNEETRNSFSFSDGFLKFRIFTIKETNVNSCPVIRIPVDLKHSLMRPRFS